MSKPNIIRAWKDKAYRDSLSPEQQALLPENPAGQVELNLDELEQVAGGDTTHTAYCTGSSCELATAGCCNSTMHSTPQCYTCSYPSC